MNSFVSKFSVKIILLNIAVIGLIALFVAKSDVYIKTTYQGLKVWATTVVPSLLPFFFLTALLTKTGSVLFLSKKFGKLSKALYRADGISLYIRLSSLISGYPVGAKIIADLYSGGIITSRQAEKYCTFTSTSGPLFIVGVVAIGAYQNAFYGFIMLLSHYLSSVLVGVIFRKLPDNRPIGGLLTKKDCDAVLYESMYSSVISVLLVGGFIAVFYTFSEMALDLNLLFPFIKILSPVLGEDFSKAFLVGLIECTHGALSLARVSKGTLSCALSCALISFGGISVWCQSLSYLSRAKVRAKIFIASKLLHTVIAFSICYILLLIL